MSVLGCFASAVTDLETAVRDLDPECLEAEAVLEALALSARATKLAEAGRTVLARRVDECGLHRRSGHLSPAHLLAATAGTTVGEAVETIATDRRLLEQADVDDAFRAGDLSFDQASAVSRAAAADPAATGPLLELTRRETVGALRTHTRAIAAAAEDDRVGRYARQCAAARFRHGTDDDGMTWGHFRLPPDQGAAVVTCIEAEADRVQRAARAAGRYDARERYAAEALVTLVTAATAGDGTAGAAGSDPELVLMVDLEPLRRGSVEGDEICTIPGFGDVPVEVPRRILESGGFVTAVLREGTRVHAVRRYGRGIPRALRSALVVERVLAGGEVRCAAAGCDRTRVEWDHITPVVSGGATEMANLQPLCVAHHRIKTRAGPGGSRSTPAGPDPP